MHILLVVQNNSFPTDKRVAKEAKSLKEAGYEVSAISPAFGNDQSRRAEWEGINIYRYSHFEAKGGLVGFIVEYTNALIRIFFMSLGIFIHKPFKSIHVANPPDFFWPMALFYKLLGVKFIFDQHDISAEMYRINERSGKNFIYKFLNWNEKMTVRLADGIITTNESIKLRLDKCYGLKKKPCAVVYNGPSANFNAVKDKKLVLEYADRKVLLYIGEIAYMDSVEVVLKMTKTLVFEQNYRDCVVVLLGDGPDKKRLEELSKEMGLTGYVEFKGRVSHDAVMKYLHVAKVCLVPDEPNGLNEYLTLIKTLEYMKAAKPFVSFDLKETRFIGANSALYAKDLCDFIGHVKRLLDKPEEADKLGLLGRERIINNFIWNIQEAKQVSLYKQLLG